MGYLRVAKGHEEGRVFPIGEDPLQIGREGAEILINDQSASRLHAEVFRIGDSYFIRDLNSKNGTYLNDSRVDEGILREGDLIRIGTTVMAFEKQTAGGAPPVGSGTEPVPGQTVEISLKQQEHPHPLQGPARLSMLFNAARSLSATRDRKQLLGATLDLVMEATGADAGYIYTREKNSERLHPAARREKHEGDREKISKSIITNVLKNHKALMTSDALNDDRFKASDSVIAKAIHSVICCPLLALQEINGVLYLAMSHRHRFFSPEDLEFASTLAMLAGIALENLQAMVRERELVNGMIRAFTRASYMHEPEARGHMDRVAGFADAVAEEMGLSPTERSTVRFAAQLHDIGRLALTEKELHPSANKELVLKEHLERGVKILADLPEMSGVVPGVQYHHEMLDGSGPFGLEGSAIPREARIIAVCNDFDKMTSRGGIGDQGLTVKEVLAELGKDSGRRYDPQVVHALDRCARTGRLFAEREQPAAG